MLRLRARPAGFEPAVAVRFNSIEVCFRLASDVLQLVSDPFDCDTELNEMERVELELIEDALKEFGADRAHIVRTRMFVTEIDRWEEFSGAHAEFFARAGLP